MILRWELGFGGPLPFEVGGRCLREGDPTERWLLKCPADGEGRADGVEADVLRFGFGEASIGDVLVHDAEVHGELLRDGNSNPRTNRKAEAEVLALGVRSPGGVSEHEANTGFEIRDNGPVGLNKIVTGAEEATCEPGVGALDSGGKHAAK